MLLAVRIIAPDQDNTVPDGRLARPARAQHAVQHPSHRQQILERPQRPRRRRPSAHQVRPGRRNERAAAVRQHEQQLEPAIPAHPADQLKRAALQRVPGARDPDRRREAIEVGSVPCLLSMIPVAIGQPFARAVG
jgi:hypothetical protein